MKKVIILFMVVLGSYVSLRYSTPDSQEVKEKPEESEINFNKEISMSNRDPASLTSALEKVVQNQSEKKESPSDVILGIFGNSMVGKELGQVFLNFNGDRTVDQILGENPGVALDELSLILQRASEVGGQVELRTVVLRWTAFIAGEGGQKMMIWEKEITRSENTPEQTLFLYKMLLEYSNSYEQASNLLKVATQNLSDSNLKQILFNELQIKYPNAVNDMVVSE